MMWEVWCGLGAFLIILEFIVPGGIVIFPGFAAVLVGGLVHYGVFQSSTEALIAWFIISIIKMFFLRSLFMKYFEGDSHIQSVDEDADLVGTIVTVVEEVEPYKEGRVRLRETTWSARSDFSFKLGDQGVVERREGNHLIIKTI